MSTPENSGLSEGLLIASDMKQSQTGSMLCTDESSAEAPLHLQISLVTASRWHQQILHSRPDPKASSKFPFPIWRF